MENIVENNKLIAEFLGYSQPHPDYKNTSYWYKKGEAPLVFLSFHSDWNWLMRVIEKILQVCAEMDEMERYWRITDAMPYIDSVYTACVKFVKWLNEQNK